MPYDALMSSESKNKWYGEPEYLTLGEGGELVDQPTFKIPNSNRSVQLFQYRKNIDAVLCEFSTPDRTGSRQWVPVTKLEEWTQIAFMFSKKPQLKKVRREEDEEEFPGDEGASSLRTTIQTTTVAAIIALATLASILGDKPRNKANKANIAIKKEEPKQQNAVKAIDQD